MIDDNNKISRKKTMKGLIDSYEPYLQPSGRRPDSRDEPTGVPQILRARNDAARPASRLPGWTIECSQRDIDTEPYQAAIADHAAVTH